MKDLKSEKENLSKSNCNLSVALQSSKKVIKENVEQFEAKLKNYQKEISNLTALKITKLDEAREAKKESKRAKRKEMKVKVSENINTDVNSNQVVDHQEQEVYPSIPVSNFFQCLEPIVLPPSSSTQTPNEKASHLTTLSTSPIPNASSNRSGSEPLIDGDNTEELKALIVKYYKTLDMNLEKLDKKSSDATDSLSKKLSDVT